MAQGWRRNTVLQGSGRMRQLITQVSKPRANGKQRPVPNVPLPSAMLRLLKVPQPSQTEPPAEDQEIKPTSLGGGHVTFKPVPRGPAQLRLSPEFYTFNFRS